MYGYRAISSEVNEVVQKLLDHPRLSEVRF